MKLSKTNPTTALNDVPFRLAGFTPEKGRAPIYDHFIGEGDGSPIYNANGCKVQAEMVLVQTHFASRYSLVVKLDGRWYDLLHIPPGDPGIQALLASGAITVCGPSPSDIERAERRAADEKAAQEAAKAEANARKQRAEKARDEREAKLARSTEANRVRAGLPSVDEMGDKGRAVAMG
jgi:hypothetical protein